ncbi:MAG: hypothetical protein ABF593_01545 [Acetobacter papayae]|uniref:hypothetical protein n=1 Tax=Acetobacter papayae TaxID=1076592 RepID=UPI0039ECD909
MYRWFDSSVANDINNKTWNYSSAHYSCGELRQLSKLFDAPFLDDLHKSMMRRVFSAGASMANLSVELGYIDKMPYAKPGVAAKREIGDAIIFGIEEIVSPSGVIISSNARAVVLQAKIATSKMQLSAPTVPIQPNTPNSSTRKELDLLSNWPPFKLYERSRSSGPYIPHIFDLAGHKSSPFPFGWYLVAPRTNSPPNPPLHSVWPSWWMLGGAILGQSCDTQFGDFLRTFLQGNKLPTIRGLLEVGASYKPKGSAGIATDWDVLCQTIYDLVCKNTPSQTVFTGISPLATGSLAKIKKIPLSLAFAPYFLLNPIWPTRGGGDIFVKYYNNRSPLYNVEFSEGGKIIKYQFDRFRNDKKRYYKSKKKRNIPVIIIKSIQMMEESEGPVQPLSSEEI